MKKKNIVEKKVCISFEINQKKSDESLFPIPIIFFEGSIGTLLKEELKKMLEKNESFKDVTYERNDGKNEIFITFIIEQP